MTFNRFPLLSIVPILIILLLGSTTLVTFAQTPPLSKTYTNALCGLSINYPDNWIVEESNSRYEEGQSSLVDMAELTPNTLDGFKSTVELEAEGMSPYEGKSIEEIGIFMKDFLSGPGASIIHSMRNDIQGIPAHEILYEQTTSKGDIWKIRETYIPFESTLYVIRYFTTSSDFYDKYVTVVDDMIQSVKVDGRVC